MGYEKTETRTPDPLARSVSSSVFGRVGQDGTFREVSEKAAPSTGSDSEAGSSYISPMDLEPQGAHKRLGGKGRQ